MSEWLQPVVDREAGDAELRTQKGMLCAGDMNRIEDNAVVVLGICGAQALPRLWQDGDFIYERDMLRLAQILESCKAHFAEFTGGFMPPCVPPVPLPPFNHWQKLNVAEGIEYQLYRIWTQNVQEKFYAGSEAVAGQAIGVL